MFHMIVNLLFSHFIKHFQKVSYYDSKEDH